MACPTLVFAQNCLFARNSATEKGAAFSIFNIYLGGFTNVTFDGNFGEHHGADGARRACCLLPNQRWLCAWHAYLHLQNEAHAEAPTAVQPPTAELLSLLAMV